MEQEERVRIFTAPMITVLLVDDDPALFNVTKLLLERDGDIEVEVCSAARRALELIGEHRYDVIISDYDMPVMNGLELLRTLRSRGYRLPFIMFTGRGNEKIAIDACNSGADFYLKKGGDPSQLFRTLRAMVQDAAALQTSREGLPSERLLAEVLDTMSDLLIVVNQNMQVSYCNPSAYRTLGYSREELLSQPFIFLLSPQGREMFTQRFPRDRPIGSPQGVSGTSPLIIPLEFLGGSGSLVTCEAQIDPIPSGYVIVCRVSVRTQEVDNSDNIKRHSPFIPTR